MQNCNFSKWKWKWKRHNAQAQLISKPPLAWNTSFLGAWLRSHCQVTYFLHIFTSIQYRHRFAQFSHDLIEKDFPPDQMSACLKVWAWRHSLSAPFVWPETHSICLYQRSVWCTVHSTEWLVLSAYYLLVSSRGAYHIHTCIPNLLVSEGMSKVHTTRGHDAPPQQGAPHNRSHSFVSWIARQILLKLLMFIILSRQCLE